MANVDWPRGLRPIRNGKAGTAPQITKYVRSSTGVIYEGDLLFLAETGPDSYNGTTAIQDALIVGVSAHYATASETGLFVYDDPDQLFQVQGDSAVASPRAAISRYCNLIGLATGNATTLQSKIELDTSEHTSARAAHDVVQIMGLVSDVRNTQTAANADWVVKIAEAAHIFTNGRTVIT